MEAAKDLVFRWTAGEVCFDCPCGAWEIILSAAGDEKTCDCGKKYRLIHYVAEVKE